MIYKNELNITMKNKILLLTAATSLLLGCVSGNLQDSEPQVISEAKWKPVTKNNWDAATRGNTELIKKMLAEGMNVDIKDEEGMTALYRAAHNDQKETVSLLLDKGANVNIKDKFGNTPLDVTLNESIAKMLREYGGKTGQELK